MAAADSISTSARWWDIPGYPGYRVSDHGRVKSLRHRNGLAASRWRILKPVPDGHGYPQVRLSRRGDRPRWFGIHQLVLLAFVGPPPAGQVARHVLVKDPTDNRLVNLAYGTQAENCQDKERHGTDQRGERHWRRLARNQDPAAPEALNPARYPEDPA